MGATLTRQDSNVKRVKKELREQLKYAFNHVRMEADSKVMIFKIKGKKVLECLCFQPKLCGLPPVKMVRLYKADQKINLAGQAGIQIAQNYGPKPSVEKPWIGVVHVA